MNITKNDVYNHFPKMISRTVHLDINDGWLALVEELFTKLERVDEEFDCHIKVTLVEGKFGGLCVSVEHTNNDDPECVARIENLTTSAEYKSYCICEICGDAGTVNVKGLWLFTTCEKHS